MSRIKFAAAVVLAFLFAGCDCQKEPSPTAPSGDTYEARWASLHKLEGFRELMDESSSKCYVSDEQLLSKDDFEYVGVESSDKDVDYIDISLSEKGSSKLEAAKPPSGVDRLAILKNGKVLVSAVFKFPLQGRNFRIAGSKKSQGK